MRIHKHLRYKALKGKFFFKKSSSLPVTIQEFSSSITNRWGEIFNQFTQSYKQTSWKPFDLKSTERISCTLGQWVFPCKLHNYWLKSNSFPSELRKKDGTDSLRQTQTHHEVFTAMKAAEEGGRWATARVSYNYQQQLHKQRCSSHLPRASVTSVHSSHSCYTGHGTNMFTPLQIQAICYLLLLNTIPVNRDFCVVFKYISLNCDFCTIYYSCPISVLCSHPKLVCIFWVCMKLMRKLINYTR